MTTLNLRQADRQRSEEREFLFLGCTPTNENCTQAGYEPEALKDGQIECEVLINQLRREHGKEPEECEFFILEQTHDFGIYHEAAIFYNQLTEMEYDNGEDEKVSETYAMKCELLPEQWDEEAKKELRLLGHSMYQPAKVIRMKMAS